MNALLADLCAVAILAGVGYFVGGYWLGFAFGAGGMAAVAIALINAREDADCDGHAQQRMDDDGAPTELGQWPFGKKDVDETELEREAREYAEGETPMTDAEIDAAARFHFFGEGEG